MTERVHYEPGTADTGVATIRLDDGKANAIQTPFLAELNAALDRAEAEPVHAIVLTGRPGFFSAGLDLKVLPDLDTAALAEVGGAFADTMRRLFLFPKPVVAAATGHAIAGGMMLYLAADLRLAARLAEPRFGLNEATTGIPLLAGTAGLCRSAIPVEHQTELILHGHMMDADEALARRVIHAVVEPGELLARAHERAVALAEVDPAAYGLNKRIVRERFWDEATATAASLATEAPSGNAFERIRR